MKNKDLHDKAWNLLEEKGLTLNERMLIRSAFVEASGHKDIKRTRIEGEVYYHSTHDLIENYLFKTEDEVVLANAIYLNMNENNGINEFRGMLKYTCRVIGLNSEWS